MSYTVEANDVAVPVRTYLNECVDVERFLQYCRECGNYDRRWSCPPFHFPPLQLWRQYDHLRLFSRVLFPAEDETLPDLLQGMLREKARLRSELLALEKRNLGSLALSAGGCNLCGDDCTRPEGKPCRNLSEMRYSIDALGGDIGKTMKTYFHRPIVWIQNGEVPEYLTLMGGLLLK